MMYETETGGKMKRIALFIFFGLITIHLGTNTQPVVAQSINCGGPISGLLSTSGSALFPVAGLEITVDILAGEGNDVKNLVVFGQDPEEEGLSLNVSIHAVDGIVRYDETWPESACLDKNGDEVDYDYCLNSRYYGIYHIGSVDRCHRNLTSPAHRTIRNVKIWLEPSSETANWLGWTGTVGASKAPLRYVFPDKWMAGTWTADGFTTTGTPDNSWSPAYYERWLEQLENFNFLAGDTSTVPYLWSVTLVEVTSPKSGDGSLGIFGNFATGPYPTGFNGGLQNINYKEMNSYITKHGSNWVSSNYESDKPLPEFVQDLHLNMSHIPMDLPGKWRVGVAVELNKAKFSYFYHGHNGEEIVNEGFWGGEPGHWYTEEDQLGYSMEANYFYEYVILSAPCNPLEEKNCWDESY